MGGPAQADGGSAPESSACLYTSAESSPGDRVLGEVEKGSPGGVSGKEPC